MPCYLAKLVYRFNFVNHPYHGDFAERYKNKEPPETITEGK